MKREIRSRKLKDRQYNGQKKKDNNYLQSTTHKTKEQEHEAHLKPEVSSGAPEG